MCNFVSGVGEKEAIVSTDTITPREHCIRLSQKMSHFLFTSLQSIQALPRRFSVEMSDVCNFIIASLTCCPARQKSSISLSVKFVGAAQWLAFVITVLFLCQDYVRERKKRERAKDGGTAKDKKDSLEIPPMQLYATWMCNPVHSIHIQHRELHTSISLILSKSN